MLEMALPQARTPIRPMDRATPETAFTTEAGAAQAADAAAERAAGKTCPPTPSSFSGSRAYCPRGSRGGQRYDRIESVEEIALNSLTAPLMRASAPWGGGPTPSTPARSDEARNRPTSCTRRSHSRALKAPPIRTPQMGRRDELRALQTYGWVVGRSSRPVLTCEEAYVFLFARLRA